MTRAAIIIASILGLAWPVCLGSLVWLVAVGWAGADNDTTITALIWFAGSLACGATAQFIGDWAIRRER